jgi:hypothetical protein
MSNTPCISVQTQNSYANAANQECLLNQEHLQSLGLQKGWEAVLGHVDRLVDNGTWNVTDRREKP